ncbi:hypothetical protein [Paenibacillus agricola]|uniref:Uncharacterized protein n=1 Tax=Paenibacillus agricola TaxID=2716264 RepID=A0ABX0JCC6_9BACL|nr:hypothetical protein [Paenibacillus agricola]NHN33213.1 hypothetical protein [Paenibacillus agricola]
MIDKNKFLLEIKSEFEELRLVQISPKNQTGMGKSYLINRDYLNALVKQYIDPIVTTTLPLIISQKALPTAREGVLYSNGLKN